MAKPRFVPHPKDVADAFVARGHWNDDTTWGWLDDGASLAPEKAAVQEASGRSCTYSALSSASHRFANALLEIGLRKGDVVAIQLQSCIEFLIVYFGVTRMGGVLATMHMPFRQGELNTLLRFSEAKAVICGAATEKYDGPSLMQQLRETIPDLKHIIIAGSGQASDGCLHMPEMIEAHASRPVADPPVASDPALLCFTSGTSSAPKAVAHTYETLAADARIHAGALGLTPDDRSMIAPPFTHIFGLECVNNAVHTGGTVLPLDHFTPALYADMLEKLRPTIVYSAPAHLAATLKAEELHGRDLRSIRHIILGGSLCPPHLAREFETYLPNGGVGNLFGMTESLIVTQTPIDGTPEVRHSTVGCPIPGIEARVVDTNDQRVEEDQEGELQLRGPTIMTGYLRNDAANAKAFTSDSWFRTGDLAMWDGKGNIVITGRMTDVINRGGVKINPSDIENAISEHKNVVHAALVPVPDDVLGERSCAVVTLVHGTALTLDELCDFLGERGIAKVRWPERLVFVDEMPMTPTKKIIKADLRRRLRELQ